MMPQPTALILCLGHATRMRPLSLGTPKSLLKFCLRPLLEYTLEQLLSHDIKDIAIVAGVGVESFDDYPAWGLRRGANIRVVTGKANGSAAVIRDVIAAEVDTTWRGVDDFLVVYGDSLLDIHFSGMLAAHRAYREVGGLMTVACHEPDDLVVPGQSHTNYGILSLGADGRLERFREKPPVNELFSRQASAGVFLINREALDMIPADGPADLSRDVIAHAAIGRGSPVFGYDISPGYRYDVGTLDEYRRRQLDVVRGQLKLDNVPQRFTTDQPPDFPCCRIDGCAFLGAGCSLAVDGVLCGTNVLDDGVTMERGCQIQDSVILDNAHIGAGARICNTILGPSARVGAGAVLEDSVLAGWSVVSATRRVLGSEVSDLLTSGKTG